eukprot:15482609-Alexandrium_andersonii.AAC.1
MAPFSAPVGLCGVPWLSPRSGNAKALTVALPHALCRAWWCVVIRGPPATRGLGVSVFCQPA